MFFTRTIRRKLLLGLALVLVMLITLSLSGISGLSSYRNVVKDLEYSINQAPRRAELSSAVGMLFKPLLLRLNDNRQAAKYQRHLFELRLESARQQVEDFRRKLDNVPPTPATIVRRSFVEALLAEFDHRFADLQSRSAGLGNAETRGKVADELLKDVAHLDALVQRVPPLQEGLSDTLRRARRDYSSRLWLVSVTSGIVLVLFFGLVVCGYTWVFAPIRMLHRGALRVAQGDFDYRLKLKSRDEMSELADAFNKMTARFQEITSDLDRQVCERSKQLVRSERLAGVGFLSAGVAHEINNPLSAIVMAADSLRERTAQILPDDDEEAAVIRQYLEMIGREAQRCREITAKLLDFSRGQDVARGRNDLTHLVAEVLSMVQHLGKFRDRRILFSKTEPCFVEVHGPEIKQVVLNLVANALESMESGGTLSIEIAAQTDHVLLTFRDDGCGMTPAVVDHLFEPFFTQKASGKGTGLGLSISHRIISDHGGTIEAESDGPGQGSTFRIHLPRKATAIEVAA